jgi:hypothetical protein
VSPKVNFFKAIIIALTLLVTAAEIYAVTYEPLPNHPSYRGFDYYLNMADCPQLLSSNMPYMQGYIVADSLVKIAPMQRAVDSMLLQMNLFPDTINYIYKYWYLMTEYAPLRFYAFMNKRYSNSNNNDQIGLAGSFGHRIGFVQMITYYNVLDTLKCGTFPSLDSTMFYNGPLHGNSTGIVGNTYSVPNQTDIVFSYPEHWLYTNGHECIIPCPVDSNGNELPREQWIKKNKEYIVFLGFLGDNAIGEWEPPRSVHKEYYFICPIGKNVV